MGWTCALGPGGRRWSYLLLKFGWEVAVGKLTWQHAPIRGGGGGANPRFSTTGDEEKPLELFRTCIWSASKPPTGATSGHKLQKEGK